MYPNDLHFQEHTITKAEALRDGGWHIKLDDGSSFFVPQDSPIEPASGMAARLYGKGIGFRVRGLYLDGVKVYYRTEAEDKAHHEVETYGADAADWLARWDAGKTVWSIEMGGLGPSYEQCIQITAAEILRHLLAEKYDAQRWAVKELWGDDRDAIHEYGLANEIINGLGLSGAQWGAALSLAAVLYRDGPRSLMATTSAKGRQIQVQRDFPQGIAACPTCERG